MISPRVGGDRWTAGRQRLNGLERRLVPVLRLVGHIRWGNIESPEVQWDRRVWLRAEQVYVLLEPEFDNRFPKSI